MLDSWTQRATVWHLDYPAWILILSFFPSELYRLGLLKSALSNIFGKVRIAQELSQSFDFPAHKLTWLSLFALFLLGMELFEEALQKWEQALNIRQHTHSTSSNNSLALLGATCGDLPMVTIKHSLPVQTAWNCTCDVVHLLGDTVPLQKSVWPWSYSAFCYILLKKLWGCFYAFSLFFIDWNP